MKKLLIVTLFCLLAVALLADIMSTTYGGNWMNASTWIGGVVPNLNSNVIIQGPVYVNTTNECLNLTVLGGGTITNPYNEIGQVTVYANCTNYGQIVDGGPDGEVRLVVLGNILTTNMITCEYVYFAGNTEHTFASVGTFSPTHFIDMGYANITLLSDLSMTGTHVNLPILSLNGGFTSHVTLNGGFMEHTNIHGGNGATLNLINGAYMYNITADELMLQGTVLISGPVSIGNLYNYGSIYNRNDADYSLVVTGRLDNHGSIGNNPAGHYLNLDLYGDIYNYQTINPQYLTLGSDTLHDLWQSTSATALSAPIINCNGDYRMLSNFSIAGSNIAWNSHNLMMHNNGSGFMLGISGGNLVGANIDGSTGSTLNLSNNAWLSGIYADQLVFNGTVLVGDGVEIFQLTNNGTLRSMSDYPHTLTVFDRLANYGSIANASNGIFLWVNLWGDLINNGQISNFQFTLYGSDDQSVLHGSGSSITCFEFRIHSNMGYVEWYFNGQPTDTNHSELRTVNPYVFGVWNPYNYGEFGKNIVFGSSSGALPATPNVNASLVGTNVKLLWMQVPGAIYYTVYAADSPDGTYTALPIKAFDYNLGDGIVEYELTPSAARKFYTVTTGN